MPPGAEANALDSRVHRRLLVWLAVAYGALGVVVAVMAAVERWLELP